MTPIPIFANQKIKISYKTTENINILIRGIVLLKNGEISQITETKNVTGVATQVLTSGTFYKPIPEGTLISYTVKTTTANRERGQSYIKSDIIFDGDDFEIVGLCAGYVTTNSTLNLGTFEDSLSGYGYVTNFILDNPATGDELVFQLNSGLRYKILLFGFRLTTIAAGANRTVGVFLGSASSLTAYSLILQGAGLAKTYILQQGIKGAEATASDQIEISLANGLFLSGGITISTNTTNLNVDDEYSEGVLIAEQFIL